MKEGGGAEEGSFLPFFPHPLPALLLAPFVARSLTLVPRSLLLKRTETLATQARVTFSLELLHVEWDRTFSVFGASENSGW